MIIMKLRYMFAVAAAALAIGSCSEDAVAPLTGMYPAPEEYKMDAVLSQPVVKGDGVRTFTVELATEGVKGTDGVYSGTGNVLRMKFVCDKYFLANASYTPATSDAAKNGNYIVGQEGAAFCSVSDGQAKEIPVDYGSLLVSSVDGKYSFSGCLWLADETVIKVNSSVELVYEPDLEPVRLTKVLEAAKNQGIATVKLGTAGVTVEFDPSIYSNVYKGTGNYLAIDFYSADGFLHTGTYKPSAEGGKVGEGEYSIGYDTTMDWGWGPQPMYNWGTCWWTVNDGNNTAEKILEGEITVTKTGSTYTISYNHNGLWAEFNGAIEALNPDKIEYAGLTKCASAVFNGKQDPNNKSLTINLTTDDVTASPNMYGGMDFSGSGNYLAIDLYSEDGTLKAGSYKPCAEGGKVGENEFGIGWDPGDIWNMGYEFTNWGTCWWTVASSGNTAVHVTDGILTVEQADGNYTITLESSAINARYTGPIEL